METAGHINFPKMELDFQILEDLERSLQEPMLPPLPLFESNFSSNFLTNALVEYPCPIFSSQPNNNNGLLSSQSFDALGADFHLWNECPPLCEDAWKPLSQQPPLALPCIFDNPKPLAFDHNDHLFLPNNVPYVFNDETLSMVVAEGLSMGARHGNVGNAEIVKVEDAYEWQISEAANNFKLTKIDSIQYEEIRKCFDMPISKAAKELNVGLTVLKKRCRELNIKRWPHRKIKSLEALISNVKELGMVEVVEVLEEHKRKLQVLPWLELTEDTKKLRQACFKANYKKRKALALTQ